MNYYDFFQSTTWKTYQKKVLNNKIIELEILGQKYFGIIKEKKIGKFSIKRLQILSFFLPDIKENQIKNELKNLKKKYNEFFLIQFGITNIKFQKNVKELKKIGKNKELLNKICKKNYGIEKQILKLGLKKSIRENMPPATTIYKIYDISKNCSELCKRMIKKAEKNCIKIKKLNELDNKKLDKFYNIRKETLNKKGKNIISQKQYKNLVKFLKEGNGDLLIAINKDNEILAGSIILFFDEFLVYLYGFSNRKYSKLGAHYFLHYKIGEIYKNNFKLFDTLGVSPLCKTNHELKSVGNFKFKFGGDFLEFYGNFDLIINYPIYIIFRIYRKLITFKHKFKTKK